MRKKAVNRVYDVVRAVHELEKDIGIAPVEFAAKPACRHSRELMEARRQLDQVLQSVSASDFRNHNVVQ